MTVATVLKTVLTESSFTLNPETSTLNPELFRSSSGLGLLLEGLGPCIVLLVGVTLNPINPKPSAFLSMTSLDTGACRAVLALQLQVCFGTKGGRLGLVTLALWIVLENEGPFW